MNPRLKALLMSLACVLGMIAGALLDYVVTIVGGDGFILSAVAFMVLLPLFATVAAIGAGYFCSRFLNKYNS